MSPWAIIGITIGGLFAFLIVIGALVGGDDTADDKATAGKTTAAAEAPAAQPSKKAAAPPAEKPAEKAPVTVTAKKATFTPSILHDGGDFTSVTVTITNNSTEKISVNPLYFTITDSIGEKHQAQLGEDEKQIDTMDLAPGEKATGVITGEGSFTPKYVTYVDGMFGDGVRGNVS
ncbi:DUF4352 domain-containing protein [Streptomyces sp. ISL-36]|nr:DUF4352 domain-containing protein [Streptomyces sp. ISL-36]